MVHTLEKRRLPNRIINSCYFFVFLLTSPSTIGGMITDCIVTATVASVFIKQGHLSTLLCSLKIFVQKL